MENKYGANDVVELFVFNEDGKLITELDTLQDSRIMIDDYGNGSIFIKDALLDVKLLRFQYDNKTEEQSDFETLLKQVKGNTITFNRNKKSKKCKIIATSLIRNGESFADRHIYYEIPEAEILNKFDYNENLVELSAFDIMFKILPNEDGDLFKLHNL